MTFRCEGWCVPKPRRSDVYVLTSPFLSGKESTTTISNQNRHLRECKKRQELTGGASYSSASQSCPDSNGAVTGDGLYEYRHGGGEYEPADDEYRPDDDECRPDDDEY